MNITETTLTQCVSQLADLMVQQKLSLVAAESCTGGWIAKCCTDLPGSSAWFERGFVTYSNESKQSLLGVSIDTLAQYGAVSAQTAEAMASGALRHSLADISVAVTGIAGPDGGSAEKPVGTVWFAWARKDRSVQSECHHFDGDREYIRRQAVQTALEGIIKNARD